MADSAATVNNQIEQGPSNIGSDKTDSSGFSAIQWLVAWTVLIVALVFLAKSRIGYLVIYYALVLSLVFLVVTQYKWFAGVLAPFQSLRPGLVTGGQEEAAPSHSESNGGGSAPAPTHSEK